MLKSVVAAVVLLATTTVSAQMLDPKDPCVMQGNGWSSPYSFPDSNDSLVSALQLSREERLQAVCELKRAFQDKYSLWNFKKLLVGTDMNQHFIGCALEEVKTPQSTRFDFYDRVTKCLAGTQDTHVNISFTQKRPYVLTLIDIRKIQNKAIVTSINSGLISLVSKTNQYVAESLGLDKILTIGAEILEIDGQPVDQAAKEMAKYIAASSAGSLSEEAYGALTMRSFKYPVRPYLRVKIKTTSGQIGTLAIPWFTQFQGPNLEAQEYFKQLGVPNVDAYSFSYNADKGEFERVPDITNSKGYHPAYTLFDDKDAIVYEDPRTHGTVLRSGVFKDSQQRSFCYMYIRSFNSNDVQVRATATAEETDESKAKDLKPIPFMDAVLKSVSTCKEQKLPMILDLRYNGGGNGNFPAEVLSALARSGETYGSTMGALRATRHTVQLATSFSEAHSLPLSPEDGISLMSINGMNSLKKALMEKQETTSWGTEGNVVAHPQIGGYNEKIVSLISPSCVSACDITARLLKNSGRAQLIGTTANGTGAGFMSLSSFSPDFMDSQSLITVTIPNFLFTVAEKPLAEDFTLDFKANMHMIMENRPTVADIQYETTMNDVTKSNEDLKKLALETLFAK